LTAIASLYTGSVSAFVIDTFNTGDRQLILDNDGDLLNPRTATQPGLSDSGVIGTARDIQILIGNPGAANTSGGIVVGGNANPPGSFVANRSNGAADITYSIVWDGTTTPTNPLTVTTTGFGNRDFQTTNDILNPNVTFRFDITNFNDIQAGSTARLTVWTDNGLSRAVNTISNIDTLGAGSDLFFNFNAFIDEVGTRDFTRLSAIRFDLTLRQFINSQTNLTGSSNFGIDSVETIQIPFEFNPAIGIGIVGLAFSLSKLKKSTSSVK